MKVTFYVCLKILFGQNAFIKHDTIQRNNKQKDERLEWVQMFTSKTHPLYPEANTEQNITELL